MKMKVVIETLLNSKATLLRRQKNVEEDFQKGKAALTQIMLVYKSMAKVA